MSKQRRTISPAEVRRILVLQFGAIGDAIFAIPALKALRGSFPGATIAVLASYQSGDVLRGMPHIDLLRICRSGLDLVRAVVEFRQVGFDLAVGLSNQGSWLAFFCGTPFKAGFASPLLSLAEPGAVKEEPSAHVVEYCLAVVRLLGAAVPEQRELELWLAPHERNRAEEFMRAHHLMGRPIMAVHPGGHYFQFKRWPPDRFAALVDVLARQGISSVLIGGADDVALAATVRAMARSSPVLAAGRLRLKETAALIARCDLFIGNDSAPLHIAAAVKTPSIGLFGPTSPAQFCPYGQGHTVIYKALPCSPCFKFLGGLWQYLPHCGRPHCMEAIGVDDVAAAALARLGLARTAAPALQEGRG